MLIMAASNHVAHFGAIHKFTGDYTRILSCYTDAELKIALPFMNTNPSITLETMLDRASIVGNLPRYLISDSLFKSRRKHTAMALAALKDLDMKDINRCDGITRTDNTIPGYIWTCLSKKIQIK